MLPMKASLTAARGRFAPSPTGRMHLGNALTALLAWLQIRSRGGQFVLRMEDLDPDRSQPQFAEQALADLRWLGLDWDEGPDVGGAYGPYNQSDRTHLYLAALAQLAAAGHAYPCFCSRADIQRAAAAPHTGDEGPRYPGTCRPPVPSAPSDIACDLQPGASGPAGAAPGRLRPAWRYRVEPGHLSFTDDVLGPVSADVARRSGDFVIWRRENVAAYQLAVVVDDAAMGITHVLRGADLADSTPRQILLYQALGLPVPTFAHVPLLVGKDGQRLAKRHGPVSLAELRDAGADPAAVVGWLACLAGMQAEATPTTPRGLLTAFDLGKLPSGQVVVQAATLQQLVGHAR